METTTQTITFDEFVSRLWNAEAIYIDNGDADYNTNANLLGDMVHQVIDAGEDDGNEGEIYNVLFSNSTMDFAFSRKHNQQIAVECSHCSFRGPRSVYHLNIDRPNGDGFDTFLVDLYKLANI
jgi:hypothetical protein